MAEQQAAIRLDQPGLVADDRRIVEDERTGTAVDRNADGAAARTVSHNRHTIEFSCGRRSGGTGRNRDPDGICVEYRVCYQHIGWAGIARVWQHVDASETKFPDGASVYMDQTATGNSDVVNPGRPEGAKPVQVKTDEVDHVAGSGGDDDGVGTGGEG